MLDSVTPGRRISAGGMTFVDRREQFRDGGNEYFEIQRFGEVSFESGCPAFLFIADHIETGQRNAAQPEPRL